MAKSNLFLRLDDKNGGTVLGECYDQKYQSQIDLLSWDWDVSDPAVANKADKGNGDEGTGAGGRSGGRQESESGGGKSNKPKPSMLSISKTTDRSTTRLLGAMESGEIFPSATLTIEERFEETLEHLPFFMEIKLVDVFVADFSWSVSADGAGMTLKEDWKLNYRSINFLYVWREGLRQSIPFICDFDRPKDEGEGSSKKIPETKSEKMAKADADFEERFNARVKKLGLHK
jgi:type VI protein secretion system component Hcp